MGRPPKEKKPALQIGPKDFRIGFHVHDVSRMRRTLFDNEMKPLGITRSQWWVLAQLSRGEGHGDGMLQTELAHILAVGKMTIGGLIDRLEARGFVARKPDKVDRRARRVVITTQGRRILDKMEGVGRRLNLTILKGIPAQDRKVAEQVLSRMKKNLREALELNYPSDDGHELD